MTTEEKQVLQVLDMTKDMLASMAGAVYRAQKDGINAVEGLTLATMAMNHSLMMMDMWKNLSAASIEHLLNVLENSDLVARPRPF